MALANSGRTTVRENLSDKALLVAEDEQSAFRHLYDRYWETLYSKALSGLGNDADAQDVVQEVFISVWRNKFTIEVEETLSPYLFKALKYCIIRKVYRQSKAGTLFPLSLEALAKTELSTEELLEYKDLQGIIAAEISNLPERMQEIYRLSRIEYLSITQIAQRLDLSEQTVKNTLTTALKKLRERLERHSKFLLFLL